MKFRYTSLRGNIIIFFANGLINFCFNMIFQKRQQQLRNLKIRVKLILHLLPKNYYCIFHYQSEQSSRIGYILLIIACGIGKPFLAATCIWYDVKEADKCLEKCNSDSQCNFWDFKKDSFGILCCGRADSTGGPQTSPYDGQVFGSKYCQLGGK